MLPSQITITLMSGPRDGETLAFPTRTDEGIRTVLSIGRREGTDICLSYDNQVSRLHARLSFEDGRFWLEDLDSRNGTMVNKERVEGRVQIKPGMLFRVGRTWMRLDPLPPDDTQAAMPVVAEEDSSDAL